MRQPQPARRGAAGDDQRARVDDFIAHVKFKRTLTEIDAGHVAMFVFGAKARGLLAHVLDQFRSLNAFGKTGKVLDQRGERELASGFVAFDAPAVSGWRVRCKARLCVRRSQSP